MGKEPWVFSNSNSGKRPWRVVRSDEIANDLLGKPRKFASAEAAETAAEDLNEAEGIFVSGFKDVTDADARFVRERFLAGDSIPEVRAHFRDDRNKLVFSFRKVRRMRDEVFAALVSNPDAVKALADGPILNPAAIVKYRHSREEVAASAAMQADMFA